MKKYFIIIILFFAFFLFNLDVNAQDFTSGTYYYNTNVVTDGLGIPTTYTSNTLSMGTTPLTFSNSSRTQAWVLRSDFYSFNYQFISGHSYRISTVYQLQPYSLNGNYDMRLAGANLRFTNQGNLTANYDGKVTVYNNGNPIDQPVQYSSMTYNYCSGNYCNWTNTFYFNATSNADSIAFTHGGNNIGQSNKFMFYYPQNPSQYVPEMLTIGTAWVSIDDLGGGTDLDPLIQLEIESNSKLDSINNNIQQGNSKADDINSNLESINNNIQQGNSKANDIDSKLTTTNTILGTIQNGIESFKNAVNLQLGNIKSTLDYILSGMSSLLNKIIEGQEICDPIYQTKGPDILFQNSSLLVGDTYGSYLLSDGNFSSSPESWRTTPFIHINGDYKLYTTQNNTNKYYCIYNMSQQLTGCYAMGDTNNIIPQGGSWYYIRYSYYTGRSMTTNLVGPCSKGNETIFKKLFDGFNNIKSKFDNIISSIGNGLGNIVNAINGKIVDLFNFFTNEVLGLNQIGTIFTNWLDQFDDNPIFQDVHTFLESPKNMLMTIANTNNNCTDITTTAFNQSITIPSGCIFWNRQDVSSFRQFWNALFGGFIVFSLGFKYFKVIHNALDPSKDDLGGLNI